MIILVLTLALLGTVAAAGITGYAMYITSQVSGDKLLTMNSEIGYKYATTYHNWQIAAAIAVAVAVVFWILFIVTLIGRHKRKKKKQLMKGQQNKSGNVQ